MTYTYAVLEISKRAYAEIRAKLDNAGYQHAFHKDGEREVIDMVGIALKARREMAPQRRHHKIS